MARRIVFERKAIMKPVETNLTMRKVEVRFFIPAFN